MGKIFISYRRSDSKTATTHIYRELAKKFGAKNIFFDVDAIDGGQNFTQAIASFITQSDVLLAIIGQKWLDVKDANGNRRLDDPDDFVREEVGLALTLPTVTVIPVIVNDASPPPEDQLPRKLRDLAMRNAVFVRDGTDYERDMQRLIREIKKAIPTRRISPVLLGGAALVLTMLLGLFIVLSQNNAPNVDPANLNPANLNPANLNPANLNSENINPANIDSDNTDSDNTDSSDLEEPTQETAAEVESTPAENQSTSLLALREPICENGEVVTLGYSGEIVFQRTTQRSLEDDEATGEDDEQNEFRDLILLNLATCEEQNLTNTPEFDEIEALWFGRDELLYLSDETGANRVYVLNLETEESQRITGFPAYQFSLSDQNVLYFSMWDSEIEGWNIFKYHLETEARARLTAYVEDSAGWRPSVAPDESFVLYDENRGDDLNDIIRLDLETNVSTNLSDVDAEGIPENSRHQDAKLSLDGRSIIFVYDDENVRELWIMDVDGSNKRPLLPQKWVTGISWSENGDYIIFSTSELFNEDENIYTHNLWIVNADGSNPRQIFNTLPYESEPAWRPGS